MPLFKYLYWLLACSDRVSFPARVVMEAVQEGAGLFVGEWELLGGEGGLVCGGA